MTDKMDRPLPPLHQSARLSVAPMMDWTDRHCRMFHRMISAQALLYTEMITSAALIRGDARHLLAYSPQEQPVALQLGGSDPKELALAARLGAQAGYGEINLNVGCPSDRVQSGAFGAVLMKSPELVGECVAAMRGAQEAEVTVKCRIGVDDQEPQEILPAFLQIMQEAGVARLTIHARKAWLQGLSPKQNRDIPPLDYDLVYAMKRAFPDLHISINGGVESLDQARRHLEAGMDGVMIGRAAYHQPFELLSQADQLIFGRDTAQKSRAEIIAAMEPYIEAHLAAGGKLAQITRHMIGLFAGQPGARHFRRVLSEKGQGYDVGLEVLHEALGAVQAAA
ncbi:MAG: tRNA dihydrouridine(20/20a) synthase DusA [Paracoccaceae bacterium]